MVFSSVRDRPQSTQLLPMRYLQLPPPSSKNCTRVAIEPSSPPRTSHTAQWNSTKSPSFLEDRLYIPFQAITAKLIGFPNEEKDLSPPVRSIECVVWLQMQVHVQN